MFLLSTGILSQELTEYMQEKFGNYTSYIAASYVKHVESAGARVVPIKWVLCARSIICLLHVCSTDNAAVPLLCVTSRLELPGGTSDSSLSARARKKKHPVYRFNKLSFCWETFTDLLENHSRFSLLHKFYFFLFLSCYRNTNTAKVGSKFSVYFYSVSLITSQCSCLKKEAVWGFPNVGTHRQSAVYRDRLSDLRNVQQKYFCVTSLCWYKCHFKQQHLILLPLQSEIREHAQRRNSRTLLPPNRSAHKARVLFTAALSMKHPVWWEK